MKLNCSLALPTLALGGGVVLADVLEFKNGSVLNANYLGGTAATSVTLPAGTTWLVRMMD